MFINFEGLIVNALDEAEILASFVDRRLHDLGRRVNLIVNYDNFELGRPRRRDSSRWSGGTSSATSCPPRATRPTLSCGASSAGRSRRPGSRSRSTGASRRPVTRLASRRGAGAPAARPDHELLGAGQLGSVSPAAKLCRLSLAVGGPDRAVLAPPTAGRQVGWALGPSVNFPYGLMSFQPEA